MFTFSFLWAAWKAEENVSTEINTHRLYESPEYQCPMEKSKGGGIIYIILQIFFLACMNVAVSCEIIFLAICCCGHFYFSFCNFSFLCVSISTEALPTSL
jgi:hypothetical protein